MFFNNLFESQLPVYLIQIVLDRCHRGHNCHPNAQCINTRKSFKCRCHAGYIGNGTACEGMRDTFISNHNDSINYSLEW